MTIWSFDFHFVECNQYKRFEWHDLLFEKKKNLLMTIKLLGIFESDKRSISVCWLRITFETRFISIVVSAATAAVVVVAMVAIRIDCRLESIIDWDVKVCSLTNFQYCTQMRAYASIVEQTVNRCQNKRLLSW